MGVAVPLQGPARDAVAFPIRVWQLYRAALNEARAAPNGILWRDALLVLASMVHCSAGRLEVALPKQGAWVLHGRRGWWAPAMSVLLIVGLGLVVRCDQLALGPLTTDEAFSWRLATYSTAELFRHMAGDAHP